MSEEEPHSGATDTSQEAVEDAIEDAVTEQVIEDDVAVDTEVVEEDNRIGVSRTAAFAELADAPKEKAIDSESLEGDIKYFDQLRAFDPELAGTLLAQSLAVASGMDAVHPAALDDHEDEPTDLERDITDDCRDLLRDVGIKENAPGIVRDLVTHGNDVAHITYQQNEENGFGEETDEGGVKSLETLPLRALTILDGETWNNRGQTQQQYAPTSFDTAEDMDRVITDNDVYVVNEGNENSQQVYPEHDILHVALDKHRHWYQDRKNRETFEVWGERRLDPIKYAVQVKQNTMANKVAMDDKLLAREFYFVEVEELFGHIEDDKRREKKAREYAKELRKQVEGLEADQKPILPREVEIEVQGPDGETARKMTDFIQTMNDSIQHALTYHIAAFGRDAGGTDRANKPAKEMSDNSVRQLRDVLKHSFRRIFKYHAMLRHDDARVVVDPSKDDIRRFELDPEIRLPVLKFDPVDPQEQSEQVRDAISLYEKGVADLNEARAIVGLDPLDEEEIDERPFFKQPGQEMEMQEMQNQQEEDGPNDEEDEGDGENTPGDGPGGDRESFPTDSREAYETDPDEWEDDI